MGPDGDEATSDREPDTGMPRWVKVFLIVGLVLVLLFVAGTLTGRGGDHGPGRHGGDPPPAAVDEVVGHRSPVDHGP